MKFQVHLKDPASLHDAIKEAAEASAAAIEGLSDDEREVVAEKRQGQLAEFCEQWVEYSECYVLEFDTEAKTAVVVPL